MQYLKNLQSTLSQSLWISSHREPNKQRDFINTSTSFPTPSYNSFPPSKSSSPQKKTRRQDPVSRFNDDELKFTLPVKSTKRKVKGVKSIVEERTNNSNINRVHNSTAQHITISSQPRHFIPLSSNFFTDSSQSSIHPSVQPEPVILSLTPLTKSHRSKYSKRSHHGITSLFHSATAAPSVTIPEEADSSEEDNRRNQRDEEGLSRTSENLRRLSLSPSAGSIRRKSLFVDDPLLQLLGVQGIVPPLPPDEKDLEIGGKKKILQEYSIKEKQTFVTTGASPSSHPQSSLPTQKCSSPSKQVTRQLSSFHIDNTLTRRSPSGSSTYSGGSLWDRSSNREKKQGKVSVDSGGGSDCEEKALGYYIHENLTFPELQKGASLQGIIEGETQARLESGLSERFFSHSELARRDHSSHSSSSRSTTFTRDRPLSASSSEGESIFSESDSGLSVFTDVTPTFHAPVVVFPLPAALPFPPNETGLSCSHKVKQRKKSIINSSSANARVNSENRRVSRKRKHSIIHNLLCTKGFNLFDSPKKLLSAVLHRRSRHKRLKGIADLKTQPSSTSSPSSSSQLQGSNPTKANLKFNNISKKKPNRRRYNRNPSKAERRLWAKMDHEDLIKELPSIEKLTNQERLRLAHKRRMLQLKKFSQYEKDLNSNSKKHRGDSDLIRRNLPGKHINHNGGGRKGSRRIRFRNSIMLLEAAGRNDVEEVRLLLESGVNPDVANEDGLTALHQCCIDDNEEMMKILLDYGANVNSEDSEKWTPLHAAATCGHLHLVQYLIVKGANLLGVNAEGNMPYDICDDEATLDYIESEMAKRGVTQELIEEIRALPETRMLQDVQRIHAQGGDLECRDVDGATPLHIASANGYYRAAEFLLDNHVATDVQDKDFWQPIHAAACWGHLDVLELLVQNGADLDARTKNNETPYAICEDPEIKERIIQLRTEQQTKRQNEGRKRPSRTHSTNSRTQSIRRTSQRDKGLTSKRDAADEAQMLMAREEHKENSPSPTSDMNASSGGGSNGPTTAVNGTSNGTVHPVDGQNHNGNTSSEEDPTEEKRFPMGRDSVGIMKVQQDEMNRLRKIAVGSGAIGQNNHLNNKNVHASSNSNNAIKMNNLFIENGSLRKNQNNISKNLNDTGGSSSSGNSPVTVLSSPVIPDDNGNLMPKPEINPDNKVSLGDCASSGMSLNGSRDNLVGVSSSAGNSTIDIHVSVTINTNSPVSTLTNGGASGHNKSSHTPISPGSTIFTPPGTLSDLKKQRSLIRTSSNPLTNGGMNEPMARYQPPGSPTFPKKYIGDPGQPVGDYGDGGKRCCVIV